MNVNECSRRAFFGAPYKGRNVLVDVNFNSFVLALSTLIEANSFIHSRSFGLFAPDADHERHEQLEIKSFSVHGVRPAVSAMALTSFCKAA